MSERAPTPPDPRPDLRLVGNTPPVTMAPVRPVLVPPPAPPPDPCYIGCPVCEQAQQHEQDA